MMMMMCAGRRRTTTTTTMMMMMMDRGGSRRNAIRSLSLVLLVLVMMMNVITLVDATTVARGGSDAEEKGQGSTGARGSRNASSSAATTVSRSSVASRAARSKASAVSRSPVERTTGRLGRGFGSSPTRGSRGEDVAVPETGDTATVVFKISANANAVDSFSRGLGASAARASAVAARAPFVRTGTMKRAFPYGGKFEADHVRAGLHLYYEAEVDLSGATSSSSRTSRVGAALSSLRGSPGVTLAEVRPEARMLYSGNGRPNDPRYTSQGSYAHIGLEEVWKYVRGDTIGANDPIIVHVMDAGTQIDHPDIAGKLWTNLGEICGNGEDDDLNGYIDDCHGYNYADGSGTNLEGSGSHGQHCAGTIAASTNNGIGVSGVAGGLFDEFGCGGVQIMTWTMFGKSNGNGRPDLGLVYGADMGAQYSSNSWGYIQMGAVDPAVLSAIDYFNDKSPKNMVIFAAGNDASSGNYYPGFYEGAVAVASTGENGNPGDFYDSLSSFSNFGSWVEIAAPGRGILSTCVPNRYCSMSGTSMACPHVTGIVALLSQACPPLTRVQIKACLMVESNTTPVLSPNGQPQDIRQVQVMRALECVIATGLCPYTLEELKSRANMLDPGPSCTRAPPPPATPPPPPPPPPPTPPAEVEITTDRYGAEVSYSLTYLGSDPGCEISSGGVVASDTSLSSNTVYSVLVPESCPGTFRFVITDTYGDGICCAYGEGFYRVLVAGVEIHRDSGRYGSSDTYEFSVEGSSAPPPNVVSPPPPTVTPPPPPNPPNPPPPSPPSPPPPPPPSPPSPPPPPPPSPPSPPPPPPPSPPSPPPPPPPSPPSPPPPPPPSPPSPPPPPPPSPPSPPPPPPPSPPPVSGPDELTIALVTDRYGYETSWTLEYVGSESGCTFSPSSVSGGLASSSSFSWSPQRANGAPLCEGMYLFTINDSYGDGVCCSYGRGSYTVAKDGVVIKSGGDFDRTESYRFMMGSSQPPQSVPFKLTFRTDNYGYETSFEIRSDDQSSANPCLLSRSGPTSGRFRSSTTYELSLSLCKGEAYTFVMKDSYGDGMCCSYGNGFYSLLVDGVEIKRGGQFDSGQPRVESSETTRFTP